MRCKHCKTAKCRRGHPSAQRMLEALVSREKIVGLGVYRSVRRGTILAGYIDGTNRTFAFTGRPVGHVHLYNDNDRARLAQEVHAIAYPNACFQAKTKFATMQENT